MLDIVVIVASIAFPLWFFVIIIKRKQTGRRPHNYYVEDPPKPIKGSTDFVIVARFEEEFLAQLCRETLEAEGIKCTILNNRAISSERALAFGGIQIAVESKNSQRAVELIQTVDES